MCLDATCVCADEAGVCVSVLQDLGKLYPQVAKYMELRVIDLMDFVLSTYDRQIGEYTSESSQSSRFCSAGFPFAGHMNWSFIMYA